jgi:hypothetical protein
MPANVGNNTDICSVYVIFAAFLGSIGYANAPQCFVVPSYFKCGILVSNEIIKICGEVTGCELDSQIAVWHKYRCFDLAPSTSSHQHSVSGVCTFSLPTGVTEVSPGVGLLVHQPGQLRQEPKHTYGLLLTYSLSTSC